MEDSNIHLCKCCKKQIRGRREDAEYCKECKDFTDDIYSKSIKDVRRRLEKELGILLEKKKITKEMMKDMSSILKEIEREKEIAKEEEEKSVFDLSKSSSKLRV